MHVDGPAMVLAGPGSGKTFVTVHRIRRLITSRGVDPAHILVITFTKAAALEMQQRFFRLMGEENLPVRFGTFHAVFYHILKQSAQYREYTIITETEKRKLVRDIIHNHKRFAYLQEEDIEEILTAVSRFKIGKTEGKLLETENSASGGWASETSERTWQDKAGNGTVEQADFQFLYKEYQGWLAEISKFDFDDLMTSCLRLLRDDAETLAQWQSQFRYILVDEFQDISPVQYEIIRLLAAPENNLFVVGDDDQSIYGFRGASPDCMKRFLTDYARAKQILLDVNFRCHGDIVQAAAKVIAENESRIPKEICPAHEDGTGLHG